MKYGHRFLIGVLGAIALAAVLALVAPGGQVSLAEEGIFYVDADAGGADDGSSWVDAYTDLQDALDAASAGAQIWVAEGTYTPRWQSDPLDPRTASFQLENEVAIYGGFAGTESNLTGRDWEANPTILSGDLNGDDGPDFANNDENSYHVFYHPSGTDLDGTAILDGFIITGGNANGYGNHSSGGGMYNTGDVFNEGSSPTLANCTFSGNSADGSGGGMHNVYESSPTLTNCTFEGNSANKGGGMHNSVRSSPTLTDCTFSGNLALIEGGGMYIYYYSSPELTNCSFEGNSADYGGGIWNYHYSSPSLTNCIFSDNSASFGGGMHIDAYSLATLTGCTFSGNSASRGGGMYIEARSSPTLTDCTFEGNSALAQGGGMYIYFHSSPVLTSCMFEGNSAGEGGGIFNWYYSSPVLTNCTFSSNLASASGGGMYIDSYSSPTLTNCTFSSNSASSGGGMYNRLDSFPVVINSILWANTPDEILNALGSSPAVSYSDVQGGYAGEGNINEDPSFANAANGDLHLEPGSPCIDAGNNGAPNLPDYDFEGDDRILDGDGDEIAVVDMGVDEAVYGGSVVAEVEIDVKPTSKSNVINLGSRASLPVAILTTGEFDASTVDPDTVEFASATVSRSAIQDVDRDGDLDLVLYFKIQQLDLDENSKEATLTGETYDGTLIEGTDRVKVKE